MPKASAAWIAGIVAFALLGAAKPTPVPITEQIKHTQAVLNATQTKVHYTRLKVRQAKYKVLTISQIKDESIAPRRLNAELVLSFGALAAIIAAVGIAGVLAFSVSARTNEIGIRMSLGADRGRVQRMILGEGGALLVLGLLLGVAGAYVAPGLIRGLLFGVAPHDPITFGGVALAMSAIGVVACWIPALRASRVDPAITIRAV